MIRHMDNDNDNVRKTLASALHVHHAFLTFLVHLFDVHCLPSAKFHEGREHLFLTGIKSLRIQLQEKMTFMRVQIDPIKFEGTQIHFLATCSLPSLLLLLKLSKNDKTENHLL